MEKMTISPAPVCPSDRRADPRRFAVVLACALLAACGTGRYEQQSEFSRLYRKESPHAIDLARRPETLAVTHSRTQQRIMTVSGQLAKETEEDARDDLDDELEILAYLENWVSKMKAQGATEHELLLVNLQIQRIMDLIENEDAGSGAVHRFPQALTGMLGTGIAGHGIPAPTEGGRREMLGDVASKESSFLYDPHRKRHFLKEELAAMTPEQVSMLDVSPRHPAWHSRNSRPEDPVGHFRREMERGVINALREDGDLPEGTTWDIQTSRRVLFMDEVYKSATSAKAKAEDSYGVEWKIKWGDEVQSEAVSSRLYLLAGGKVTDMVVTGGGDHGGMIMILGKKGDYSSEGDKAKEERTPENVAQLAESLNDFYGFDILPYVHSQGVIDTENASTLLRNLSQGGKKKYRPSELIGRTWVSFREFSLELRPKGYIRTLTGSSLTDLAAREDRAARGLYLFSLWLAGRDSKNDNSKTYFIKTPVRGTGSEMRISSHADGQHDLGVTLGTIGAAGTINSLKTGEDFLWKSLGGRSIRSRQAFVYMPESYSAATWSDARWMAMRIAGITDREIHDAVAASGWPDFMQETLRYKITARRNRIGEVFGLGVAGTGAGIAAPTITVDLSSPENIRAAEKKYGLVPGSLQEEIDTSHRGRAIHEVLVRDGQVVDSNDSALITQLVIQKHPAGLSDRYRRMLNRNPKALRR